MVEIRRRPGWVAGRVVPGTAVGCSTFGTPIMPVSVGCHLVERDGGKTREWRAVGDDVDGINMLRRLERSIPRDDDVVGFAAVIVGEIVARDDGGWYVYGYCCGGTTRDDIDADMPYVGGFKTLPDSNGLRAAVARRLAVLYREEMEDACPHTTALPPDTVPIRRGELTDLPIADGNS